MTYKLNPEIRKIESKIVLIYPDCSRKEYSSGTEYTSDELVWGRECGVS